ncbi:MAG: sugar phosphate isomerase/epimerase family protein [Planctomycetota bacterium]|nr:sugar phosphate isomerase/epimerase family protein [Planctomycetota bacterium]
MNTLLWSFNTREEHFPIFDDLKSVGFDGIELQITDDDEAHYAKAGKVIADLGLAATGVAGVPEDSNPASPDARQRQRALDYLRRQIDKTEALGGDVLGGPLHSSFKVFSGQGPTEDELSWSAEVLRAAGDHAQDAGIRLALEFLNRFECYLLNSTGQTLGLLDRIDHAAVGVHYDTHHAHLEEHDVGAAIRAGGDRIYHVHISESHRGTPGRGQVRWNETFEALQETGYDGWLTIEAFGRIDTEFASAVHIWRDLFPSPEQVYQEGFEMIRKMWRGVA